MTRVPPRAGSNSTTSRESRASGGNSEVRQVWTIRRPSSTPRRIPWMYPSQAMNRLARSHSGMFLPGNRRQEADLEVKGFEVTGDQRVGEGGHLRLRRMRMRLVLSDGSRTGEASWDYVERPMGLDAVVVALFRRGDRVEVLLRHGVRIPLQFGRPERPRTVLFPELVAGIVETGDDVMARA